MELIWFAIGNRDAIAGMALEHITIVGVAVGFAILT